MELRCSSFAGARTGAPVRNMCGDCAGGTAGSVRRWRDTVRSAAATAAKMMTVMTMMMMTTLGSAQLASAADTQYAGIFRDSTSFRIAYNYV